MEREIGYLVGQMIGGGLFIAFFGVIIEKAAFKASPPFLRALSVSALSYLLGVVLVGYSPDEPFDPMAFVICLPPTVAMGAWFYRRYKVTWARVHGLSDTFR